MTATPALLTRFSLSGKTAIGVQTRHFLDALPGARHLHWEREDFRTRDPRSICLERTLSARAGPLKRPGLPRRIAETMGLRRWRGDRMPANAIRRLASLREHISIVYAAPIGGPDATRMRQILTALGRPFVVHLWDMLDGGTENNPDLAWMVANAAATWCLTEPMNHAIGQPDAPLLLFTRDDTPCRARPPAAGMPLRIALLGDISSYRDGLDGLISADAELRARGRAPTWVYIGPPGVWRRIRHPARARLTPTGYLPDAAQRDAMLASCHAAFLPGPIADPAEDHRSRFSIPSRILDFTAVGLPIVGHVHPQSATAGFAPELRATMCLSDGDALAATLERLYDPVAWRAAAAASRGVFERARATQPLRTLAAKLDDLADAAAGRR